MRYRMHVAVLAVLLAAGCTKPVDNSQTNTSVVPAAPDPVAVQAAIDTVNNGFLTALEKFDTAAATKQYTSDAVVLMPGEPAWQGADVHKKMVDFMTQYSVKDVKFTRLAPLIVSGDLAVETGGFEWTLVPKKGKPMADKGKYVTVWQKQADGSWKIIRDINNSNGM